MGSINMDLSQSRWSSDRVNVHHQLGEDYGRIYSECHLVVHRETEQQAIMKLVWKSQMKQTKNGWRRLMEVGHHL